MTYIIKRTDNTTVATIPDGFINTVTDLTLIGRNVQGFGAFQNQNFVALLENFSSQTPPPRPIQGQLWFKSTSSQLFVYDGAAFILVGPESTDPLAATRARSVVATDTASVQHPIIQIVVNNEVLAIVSSETFNLSSPTIAGFSTISRGITLKNFGTNNQDVPLFGKAQQAQSALVAETKQLTDDSTNIATTEFVHNVMPRRAIIMWGGAQNEIPPGWNLCDGTNGTPDLRARFVLSVSSTVAVGTTGGSSTATVSITAAGSHNHTGGTGYTTLTEQQMPTHVHIFPGDDQLAVANTQAGWNAAAVGSFPYDADSRLSGAGAMWATTPTGGNQPHQHTTPTDGLHTHDSTAVSIMPPWYALCYIMKIV